MKRLILLSFFCLFAIFFAQIEKVHAQDSVIQTDELIGPEKAATEAGAPVNKTIEYTLPYPGMLPDNPLYFLKAARDGIVKLLINNNLKRAKFSLLNSDKRVFAGILLADKNNDELAVVTISKSNNYLDESLVAIKKYLKENPKSTDVKPFLSEMKTSTEKHLEILENVKRTIDSKYLQGYESELKRLRNIQKDVIILLHTK